MRLFSLFTSITHTFFIYLEWTAEEQKSFSSASEVQNTMDAPRPIGFAAAAPPLLSIFLPELKNHVTTNTFIRFTIEGANEFVGIVIGIKVAERSFTVRRFFSSAQLHLIVGNIRFLISWLPWKLKLREEVVWLNNGEAVSYDQAIADISDRI